MNVQYLEFVTTDVDAVCAAYAASNVVFGDPVPALGNARTARLPDGSVIGVRHPMSEAEEPLTRAYLLVDDIQAKLQQAVEAGGEVAHPPYELPGHGTFAIYFLGGVQHGLWQL